MSVIYVARSAKFGRWASDVGLSKHVYKLGVSDGDPKPLIEQGWGGETDWVLVKKQDVEGVTEEEAIARLARKAKPVDPAYYPRLRGVAGVFKILPEHVENHILVGRVMQNLSERVELKLKPADFADYLIHNALR